jgi:hypothetical protein
MDVPLIYHDPAAEFLAVYFPARLNIPEMERQKLIGEMTQELMRSLPPEQRKGYFLNPRQFLDRQRLTDAILGTMGISQEEIDRQRQKSRLLDQLIVMADDVKGLEMIVKGQDSQLDGEFFLILANSLARARAMGNQNLVQKLTTLRENLMRLTTWGKRAAKQQAAVASLKEIKSTEQLVERVLKADSDEINAMVLAARPLFDYTFFQQLTARVDASRGAERDRLNKLRDQILDLTQKLDEAARAELEDAANLLRTILASADIRSAVREHVEEIDEIFMAVLSLNLEEAERRGDLQTLERLEMISEELTAIAEEGLPPEIQLINALMRAPYPEGTQALLKERRELVTPEVLSLMDRLAEDLEKRQEAELAQAAKRLRDIKSQALLLI